MSMTDVTEAAVLNHLFGSTTYAKPAAKYLALFTAAPSDAGGGTEVTGGSYARQVAAFTISGTSPTTATSSATITFPTATASWGTITHAAIMDASTAGAMLNWFPLTASKTIANGDQFVVNSGQITITAD